MSNTINSELISGIEPLIERYDGFLLDQWGVLHDGVNLFPGVIEALQALQAASKKVVIISNSGKRAIVNQQRMELMGISPGLYSVVITSGEAAWLGYSEKSDEAFAGLGERCLFFCRDNDHSMLDGLSLEPVDSAEQAHFVLLSGLDSDFEIIDSVRTQLKAALRLGLPMICSNPDISMLEGDRLMPAPGALAQEYVHAGGDVRYIGKPWPAIYRIALQNMNLPMERIVAVGDSVHHDIKGAARMGIDGVLITNGIHREVFAGAETSEQFVSRLETLVEADAPAPRWVMPSFR